MRNYFYTTAFLVCLGWTVKAQDSLTAIQLNEVTVIGTKTERTIEESGKTISRLNRADIEASGGETLADLLNKLPGVHMDGNFGPQGANISYRVRGAASRQTLILVDGVPFNDPSGITQTFDLRYLDLNQVESVEVLKGGLSTLYGTGAAAGVINIKLRRPANNQLSGSASAEYGSFNTLHTGLSAGGTSEKLRYMISGGYRRSDGFSAAMSEDATVKFDDDGFESINLLARIGYQFSSAFSMEVTASSDDIEYDYDAMAFVDNDAFAEQSQVRLGLSPQYAWESGTLKADVFYSKTDRLFNGPDFFDPNSRFISEFEGRTIQSDILIDQSLSDNVKLVGGFNYQDISYEQPEVDEKNFKMYDPYATAIYEGGNFNLQFGGRLHMHSEYGRNLVWNVNPSYLMPMGSSALKIKGSYSTSFITPSLYQILDPFYGNADLEPEDSQSAEGGFEFYAAGGLSFGAVYFYRNDNNAIGFRSFFDDQGNFSGGEYFNIDDHREVNGIELTGDFKPNSKFSLSGHYTFMRPMSAYQTIYRVPQDKYGFALSYHPVQHATIKFTYLHVGETTEAAYPEDVTLSAYDLIDGFVSYRYKTVRLSLAVNNIFNVNYTAIRGFNTIGRNYNVGIRYNF